MLANNSSTLITNSAAMDAQNGGSGGSGSGSGEGGGGSIPGGGFNFSDERIEVGDNGGGSSGGGGNRWPRQETLELLRIRSEMEVAFRDSNLKGPLWEEVSRKMAELGYRRNGKKCKEKFENVYKYHKRTKDGRASKSDGKTYRFFEQLQALEKNPSSSSFSSPPPLLLPLPPPPRASIPLTTAAVAVAASNINVTVSSAPPPPAASEINPVSYSPSLNNNNNNNNPLLFPPPSSFSNPPPPPPPPPALLNNPQPQTTSIPSDDDLFTSSSTSSDEDIIRRRSHNNKKRKRKLKDYFQGLLHDMMEKQEDLHKKFLETLEKRDRDRMIREEAWRVQEMARMNRELDLLNHERSMAAAKDSAIVQFLQKFSSSQDNIKSPSTPTSNNNNHGSQIQLSQPPPPPLQSQPPPPPLQSQPPPPSIPIHIQTTPRDDHHSYGLALSTNGVGENLMAAASSSRWPKTEVEALIKIRANMDLKYQDNCPKGPLWEEISAQMSKLGYNRSSKRCKEKWENINKYFKKVKESNKRRHEDSKTCPYFHQLDALYKEKSKTSSSSDHHHTNYTNTFQISYPNPIKPETPIPIMARPEQQWPIQMHESSPAAMDEDDDDDDDEDDHDHDHDSENFDDEDDDNDGAGREEAHEMVTNQRQTSMSVATTTSAAG